MPKRNEPKSNPILQVHESSFPKPGTRAQTTISLSVEALKDLDVLAERSGVSRSRLIDLACRRFTRWASTLDPRDIRLIADYEVTERTSGFISKAKL